MRDSNETTEIDRALQALAAATHPVLPLPAAREIWLRAELLRQAGRTEGRRSELPSQIVALAGYGLGGAALFSRFSPALLGALHGSLFSWAVLAAGSLAIYVAFDGLSQTGS